MFQALQLHYSGWDSTIAKLQVDKQQGMAKALSTANLKILTHTNELFKVIGSAWFLNLYLCIYMVFSNSGNATQNEGSHLYFSK